MMKELYPTWLWLAFALLVISPAWGQDTQSPDATQGGAQPATIPTPAYGQENPISENPPISGLDQPGLEPHAAPLSYLQPAVHFSESVESNLENQLGGTSVNSLTNLLGSVQLERLWSNYDLAADYVAGTAYYHVSGFGFRQVQQLNVEQRIRWKRGQLAIRDCFSYLPEGVLAGAYGMTSAPDEPPRVSCTEQQTGFFGGAVGATLGEVSRLTNLTVADVSHYLSPRSSITLAGGYGFVHFNGGSGLFNNINYLANTQVSGQIAYNRLLGHRDQAALMYGYQGFQFSTSGMSHQTLQPGTSFHTHVVQLMWGHRVSGRMNFLIAAGPQVTKLNAYEPPTPSASNSPLCQFVFTFQGLTYVCPQHNTVVGAAGRFLLQYQFPKTGVEVGYSRYTSGGSGFFAGSRTDVAQAGLSRPLNRIWAAFLNGGYSKNVREFTVNAGANATQYNYVFVGAGVHRRIGHDFRLYTSYQFNELKFEGPICGGASSCTAQRHVGTIGVDWAPRPIRLD